MVNGNPGHLQIAFYDLREEKPSCQGNIFYDSSGKNGVVELAQMVLDVNKKVIKVRGEEEALRTCLVRCLALSAACGVDPETKV